jgi:hypothetical protein
MTASHATGRHTASRWVAVVVLAASLAMSVFSVTSVLLPGTELLPDRPPFTLVLTVMFVFIVYPSVGCVLAVLRPGNPIGWLFLVIGFGFAVTYFSTEYVGRAIYAGLQLPGVLLVAWIGNLGFMISVGLAITLVPLLFPGGLVLGRLRRIAIALAAVVNIGATALVAIRPGPLQGYNGEIVNPTGLTVTGAAAEIVNSLADLAIPVVAGLGLLCVSSLVVRFRDSRSTERQQLKWILFATAALLVTVALAFASQLDIAFYAALVAAASIPLATAIAVLRYRLYDIDRIISRTVSYGAVTAILALVFVGTILVSQTVLASFFGGNSVAVAASTLVVAALFQPLRRRVQSVVDRRFNRSRYDADRTVATFAGQLRDEVDLANLHAEVRQVVVATVAPVSVGVWIRKPEPRT